MVENYLKNMNWLKHKKIYFIVSLLLIALSLFSLLNWGLRYSVEFKGGTIVEYQFNNQVSADNITLGFQNSGFNVASIEETGENKFLINLSSIDLSEKEKFENSLIDSFDGIGFTELRFETVGPAVGTELIKKTIYALLIAGSTILVWIAYQFRIIKYGISAIAAMFHDSFILVGMFSLMGHFWGAEVDFLFITAVLTTLSFSVHDTIVVFDRIKEISSSSTQKNLVEVADQALTETMVRSLNNSFTIIFMLVALLLLGGSTIKWFATALLIGTILGTYSSPFVAVPLLVSWDRIIDRIRLGKVKRRK